MCEIIPQAQMDPTLETYSRQMHNGLLKKLASSKQRHIEKDSGVGLQGKYLELYDHLNNHCSVSRRSSGCSSGCPSTSTTPSPNSTVSSAYCSAASSMCDSEVRSRQKSDITNQSHLYSNLSRVPFHPEVNGVAPTPSIASHASSSAATAVSQSSGRRSRAISTASTKSDKLSSSEDVRKLRDSINNRTFEKKRLLGKGGFARVYEVVQVDHTTDEKSFVQSCAAKIIDKSRISRPQQREKVDIEVELLADSRGHPNVVSYIDSFEDANCVCILQELCNKKSLAQYIRRKQCLSEHEVCDIMQQIVSGLSHLHGKGIIHRDLKLGNILLSDNMQVKIGDFGLATRVEWGRKKTICGTPNFIAPEVLQRQGHGPEADIWALGCLLYTLLIGKPPFETACLKETYRCILKNSYRIPTTVSAEAADLVRWMLRHKPKSRPSLSEISAHAFFQKHSDYLASVHRPLSVPSETISQSQPSVTNKCDCTINVDSSTQSLPSEEKSATTIGSKIENTSLENNEPAEKVCTSCSEQRGSRSQVKSLASRLQKKLSKVSSPGKRVRAVAASFRESRKSSTVFRPDEAPLKEKVQLRRTDSNQSARTPTAQTVSGCKTWINKWVDYSNRYGFGYQMASGRICVLFNDGKHISMLPDGKIIEYASSESVKAIKFSIDDVPPCMAKYNAVLKNFTNYMDKNLRQNTGISSVEQEVEDARMLTWCRTDEYVAMYMNDGTLQVNFCKDHVKVNISNLHKRSSMRITIVDQMGYCESYERQQFIARMDSHMVEKFSAIHSQFHSIFADVNCETHPFCSLCLESGCPFTQ